MGSKHEEEMRKLLREKPQGTKAQDSAQQTTNSYEKVDESELDARGRNTVGYVVREEGTDAIDAKIVGCYVNDNGSRSDSFDDGGGSASTSGLSDSAAHLQPATPLQFDLYWIEVQSNATDTPGDATVVGSAKSVPAT